MKAAIIRKESHPLKAGAFVYRAYCPDNTPLYLGEESVEALVRRLHEFGYEDVGSRSTPGLNGKVQPLKTYRVEKPTETLDELAAQVIVLMILAQEASERLPTRRLNPERTCHED